MAVIAIIATLFALTLLIPGKETTEHERAIRSRKDMMNIYMMRP